MSHAPRYYVELVEIIRIQRKVSISDLRRELGVSRASVYRYLSGNNSNPISNLERIEDAITRITDARG
jgi:predicted transcriptional regulator